MKKNKVRRSAGSYFTNNLTLKLLSVVFAIILWSFTITRTNPHRTKRISDIPITAVGLASLEESGLTLRDVDDLGNIQVKVSVAHSDFKLIDKNYISATVDLSKITSAGTVTLPVMVSVNSTADIGTPVANPSSISVTVDELVTKSVPVSLHESGTLKEGLISLSPSYPETVEISGSSYYVEKIAKAFLDVDLSSLNDGDKVTGALRFTDEKNNAIKFTSKYITADMDVRTIKEVKINAENAIVNADRVAAGYQFESVSAGKIIICAHKILLDSIEEISPTAIDLTDKDSSFTNCALDFDLPEGVSIVPGQSTAEAEIKINEATSSVTVKRHITVSGFDGTSASITAGKTTRRITADGVVAIEAMVELSGPIPLLNAIGDADVMVRLSLSGKGAGTYELEPTVILSSAYASRITAKLISPAQVSVTIRK